MKRKDIHAYIYIYIYIYICCVIISLARRITFRLIDDSNIIIQNQ